MNEELKRALSSINDPLNKMTAAFAMPVSPPLGVIQIPDHVSNPAKWTYTRLKDYIKSFEEELDGEHEIGARLVSFGQAVTIHIEDISYWGPDIITFHGFDEKQQKVQLIQHTTQLSVLLIAVKSQGDKPRRIGFILEEPTPEPPLSK